MAQKTVTGIVTSAKMKDSVVVEVTRKVPHKLYRKLLTVSKKYIAATNNVAVIVGDEVVLSETRKMAGNKHFKVERKTK
ncbi:MAG TPA: 30S ribosomal protein S17 [Patescibacteria group bacterium]|nr:30S ribosomal protein S17 [Patescibacteria group bacterium]